MSLAVQPAQLHDAFIVGHKLRPADKLEILEMRGQDSSPAAAVVEGFHMSKRPMSVYCEDRPVAMFGIVPVTDKDAVIWLLGTEEIEDHPMTFLRHSKEWLERGISGYDFIYNFVHRENTLHIKWLEWLGFDFLDSHSESKFIFISYMSGVNNHV